MDKLKELLSRCKCGVFLTVNEHRDYYASAAERLDELALLECPPDIIEGHRERMVETNTVIELQFYPDTPIGSYSMVGADIDAVLDAALSTFRMKGS